MRIAETKLDEGVVLVKHGRGLSIALWTMQGILAVLFAFSGVIKFVMPVGQMAKQTPFSGAFIHMIGLYEILGGIGLILAAMLRILPILTPIAACGLTIIMVGATVVMGSNRFAAFPLLIGAMAAFIAYGRFRLRPIPPQAQL